MRGYIASVLCIAIAVPAFGQSYHYVHGYTRKDGTVVAPHYQTNPDNSRLNNWSTVGNVNPFTGRPGTVDPYRSPYSYRPSPSLPNAYGSMPSDSDDDTGSPY